MSKHFVQVLKLPLLLLTVNLLMSPVTSEELDPRAERALYLMTQAGDYLSSLENFSFRSRSTFEEAMTGQVVDKTQDTFVYVSRPKGLRADTRGDLMESSIYYDGSVLVAHDKKTDFYAASEFSGSLDQLTDYAANRLGLILPAAEFLKADPSRAMQHNLHSIFYVGLHSVNGTPCHHIAGQTKDGVEWQLWLEEALLLPRKLVTRDPKQPGAPRTEAVFSDWNVSAKFPEGLFLFAPPAGAQQIEFKTK